MRDPTSIPNLGSLVVPFPTGWTFEYQDQCPVEGSGPNNEFAAISFGEASVNDNLDELRNHFQTNVAFVGEMMLAVAAERGTPYGELSVLHQESDRTIYSLAATTKRDGIEGFFLKYHCLSLVSQHYISVGGHGDIDEAITTWDDILRRSTWAHQA